MASFLTVIILGVPDVQIMVLAGGHSFLLSVSCPFCEVQWVSCGAVCSWKGRLLVGISQAAQLLSYTLKIIAFCKTCYWTKRCANEGLIILYADM